MERNTLFEARLKIAQVRQLVATIYEGVYDAPSLRKILRDIAGGDLVAGQFLEACLDWDARMNKTWWYKEVQSWIDQAGFSESQVARCREMLIRFGLIEAKKQPKRGGASAHTWHYQVKWGKFWALFCEVVKRKAEDVAALVDQILTENHTLESPGLNPGISGFKREEKRNANPEKSGMQTPDESGFKPRINRGDTTSLNNAFSSFFPTPETTTPAVVVDEKYVEVWNAALNQLEAQLDRANFDTWLRGATLIDVEISETRSPATFVLGVKNKFTKDILESRLRRTVRNVLRMAGCLADLGPDDVDFRVEIAETKHPGDKHLRQVVPDEEACIALVSELYPMEEIEAAFQNMRLQHSGGRVRDPWGYVQGILRRRAELAVAREI